MPGTLAQAGAWPDSGTNGDWNWKSDDPELSDSIVPDSLGQSQSHPQVDVFPSPQTLDINFPKLAPRAQSDISYSISQSNLSPDIHSSHNNTPPTTSTSPQKQQAISSSSCNASNPQPKSASSSPKSPHSTSHENPYHINRKRTLNTLAARRYRQRRIDQMSSLEMSLKETEAERDELKLRGREVGG